MYKFETIEQGMSSYVTLALSEKDEIDKIADGMMTNNKIAGLLPMSKQWVSRGWVLQYQVSNLAPLSTKIQNLVDEKRLVLFLKGICDAVLECGEYLLSADKIIFDEKSVYIDPLTGEPRLIYVPLIEVEEQDTPQIFIKKVIHQIVHSLSAGSKLKPVLYEYTFEDNFDIRRFRESLESLNGNSDRLNADLINGKSRNEVSPSPLSAPPQAPFPLMPAAPISTEEVKHPDETKHPDGTEPSDDANSQKKKFGFFGSGAKDKKEKDKKEKDRKGAPKNLGMSVPGMDNPFEPALTEDNHISSSFVKPPITDSSDSGYTVILQQESDDPQPSGISEGYDADVTQIDGGFSESEGAYFELKESALSGAPDIIRIDMSRSELLIGRISSDEARPDIAFPREFKKIGRKHALVVVRGGELYLKDIGSVNHTFLNGQMLTPNQEYRLKGGDEITFTSSEPVKYRVML